MAATILLEIVTPRRRVMSVEATEMTAVSESGEFGILPEHADFVTVVEIGEVSYVAGGQKKWMVVGEGFAEVNAERVVLIVESAEQSDEIDVASTRAEVSRLGKILAGLSEDDSDYFSLKQACKLAEVRLVVAEKKH